MAAMRVAIMTAGSRGDVSPFTGLGHGLANAGHDVTLVTHGSFASLAARAGLDFSALALDPRVLLASSEGQGLHRSRGEFAKVIRLIAMLRGRVSELTDELLKVAENSDILLLGTAIAPHGHAIAQAVGIPSIGLYLQPLAPTAEFPPSAVGARSFGPVANRLTGQALNAMIEHVYTPADRALRARLGLPRARAGAIRRARERSQWPILHGFSPLVVPQPRDWRPGLRTVGYWWPWDSPEEILPPRLEDFLAAGAPPVFVGLGSCVVPDPAGFTSTVVRALRAAGLRGVIQRGWSGLGSDDEDGLGSDMLTVDEVAHSLVFPRVAAVVHHAGAGTTGAVLRAGVPAIPVPVQLDAAFWAARQTALGVSPGSLPLRRLTVDELATALTRATSDPSYAARARAVAARLSEEDGVAPVLAAIERFGGETAGRQ